MLGALLAVGGTLLFYPTMFALGAVLSAVDDSPVAQYPQHLKSVFEQRRLTYLPYGALPRCAIEGIVSVEDKRFFLHPGVDPIAALRVALQAIRNDHQDHGGSTITQQLSRMILREPRRHRSMPSELYSQLRVLQYALVLEHDYSKKQILELYLNGAYYGDKAQGLEQAARAYFRSDVSHLTTAQCFYLVGLLKAPTLYGNDPQGAAARRRYWHVLRTLRRNGYISPIQELGLRDDKLFGSAL